MCRHFGHCIWNLELPFSCCILITICTCTLWTRCTVQWVPAARRLQLCDMLFLRHKKDLSHQPMTCLNHYSFNITPMSSRPHVFLLCVSYTQPHITLTPFIPLFWGTLLPPTHFCGICLSLLVANSLVANSHSDSVLLTSTPCHCYQVTMSMIWLCLQKASSSSQAKNAEFQAFLQKVWTVTSLMCYNLDLKMDQLLQWQSWTP